MAEQTQARQTKRDNAAFDVALLGYYGFGNLGDELLARALVSLLTSCGVSKERIAILSKDPEKTSAALDVYSVNRNNIAACMSLFRRTNTLLMGGGGLLQDVTSSRSIYYYWSMCRMSALAGCRPWIFGQSLGPLRSDTSKRLTKDIFTRCPVRYLRDTASIELAASMGIAAQLAPDAVFALTSRMNELREAKEADNIKKIKKYSKGINLRPWNKNFYADVAACKDIVDAQGPLLGLALCAEDVKCLEEAAAKKLFDIEEIILLDSLESFADISFGLENITAMRLHCLILSFMSEIPCIALPYDPKVSSFAKNNGVPRLNLAQKKLDIPKNTELIKPAEMQSALVKAMQGALSRVGI